MHMATWRVKDPCPRGSGNKLKSGYVMNMDKEQNELLNSQRQHAKYIT
jgi:hypothetical protein